MRIVLLMVLCSFSLTVFSEASQSLEKLIVSKKQVTESDLCQNITLIEDKVFCFKESRITLNACGKSSDWPCLDEKGCLVIDRYLLNE